MTSTNLAPYLARQLRRLADRIDSDGAPRRTGWSFVFQPGRGVAFNDHNVGCPLVYIGEANYSRAHDEARP